MAVAWAVSICYIHFPEKTQKLLKENSLDDWTHNKTIQKIRESLRISKEKRDAENLEEIKENRIAAFRISQQYGFLLF